MVQQHQSQRPPQQSAVPSVSHADKTPAQRVDALKGVLNEQRIMEQFNNALKNNANAFIASIIELYSSDTKLQLCKPGAVISEALKAAVLNLPINKALGQAFIIPFYNTKRDERGNRIKVYEPTFQIGYKGLYQLAMRTGQYRIINADVVYEGELRKVSRLTGEIDLDGTKVSEKVIGYFAYIELMGGYRKALYMSVEEMAHHAKRYSKALANNTTITIETLLNQAAMPVATDSGTVGWLGNFHGMAIKTVLRNLLGKYGYLTTQLQKAVVSDNESDNATLPAPKATAPQTATLQAPDPETVEFEEVVAEQEELPTDIDPGF